MDDSAVRQFFHNPTSARQRQYEALRAVFVDNLSQKEAADRFGYSYDSFRQLVHSFRESLAQPEQPPFSTGPALGDPPAAPSQATGPPPGRPSPTPTR